MKPRQRPTHHARARVYISRWLVLVLAVLILATPVTALPDAHVDFEQSNAFIVALLFASRYIFTVASTLIGPSMGITSVLWLVMRNDAAIQPRWSWM